MRPAISPLAVSLALVLCAGAAGAQGALLVVDAAGGPGSGFASIADAVAAAADGDVLMVRSGSYGSFVVEDRTLVVMAAPGAHVLVDAALDTASGPNPAVTVRAIAPDQAVILEGLTLAGVLATITTPGSHGLSVESCDGQVWVQDCDVTGGTTLTQPRHAINVVSAEQLLLVHCTATGHSNIGPFFEPLGAGLFAKDSGVSAWDSQFTGGKGGAGALLDDSLLVAEDSVFTGGEGEGIFVFTFCDLQIDGGAGLSMDSGSKVTLVNCHTVGGAGDPTSPECSDAGPPVFNFLGSLTQLPGPTLDFSVNSPVADGQDARLDFAAQPGDVPVVLMALSLGPVTYFPKFTGVLPFGNAVLFFLSPLPASGEASVAFGFGDALPAGTGSSIFLQGAVIKAAGGAQLGDAAVLTTFDD